MRKKEELLWLHEQWTKLAIEDNRLLSERTNIFLLANSIWFAGFAILLGNSKQLCYLLPVVGIVLCVMHYFNATAALRGVIFSWSRLGKLEERLIIAGLEAAEFIPHKVRWDFFHSRERYESEEEPRGLLDGGPIKNTWLLKVGPSSIATGMISILFIIVWIVALIVNAKLF